VENCFQHGFGGEAEEGKIWKIQLREYQKKDCWYLEIANNGVPFPEEQMLKLQKLKQTILRDDLQSVMQDWKNQRIWADQHGYPPVHLLSGKGSCGCAE
jgi:two-component sensor histidine kinase